MKELKQCMSLISLCRRNFKFIEVAEESNHSMYTFLRESINQDNLWYITDYPKQNSRIRFDRQKPGPSKKKSSGFFYTFGGTPYGFSGKAVRLFTRANPACCNNKRSLLHLLHEIQKYMTMEVENADIEILWITCIMQIISHMLGFIQNTRCDSIMITNMQRSIKLRELISPKQTRYHITYHKRVKI